MERGGAKEWIKGDESAKEMMARVFCGRPPLMYLPPPLHSLPLRLRNIVEIVGPSPSAKTHILMQAAISCILPKEWNGVHYGGLDSVVMFLDLDCRFDILHFSQSLQHHIKLAEGPKSNIGMGPKSNIGMGKNKADSTKYKLEKEDLLGGNVHNLSCMCLRRFFYIRCYSSLQFLATLKTMHKQIQEQQKTHGSIPHVLMIDSIGAFYWTDLASSSLPSGDPNRKGLSLQVVSETVVEELRKLLLVHPMLVLATKTVNMQDLCFKREVNSASKKASSHDTSCLGATRSNPQNVPYREYMPSVWQNFVTHRVLIRTPGEEIQNHPTFSSEWLLPPLNITDKFTVRDNAILTVP